MSVDREYKIRIVTSSEGDGARRSSEEMDEVTKSTGKTTEVMHGLHGIVRQVTREFPELGHLAHAAFNPLTLVVGGAIAAVELYKHHLEETTKLISSGELQDSPFTNIHRATQMTQALQGMSEAIKKAADAYNSVESASDRAAKKFEHELELLKELLKARKDNVGLAQLEEHAEKVRIAMDRAKADRLEKDAKSKMEQAGKINVNSAEDEDARMAELSANATKAQADMEQAEAALSELRRYQEGGMSFAESEKFSMEYVKKYGLSNPQDLEALLEGKKQDALNVIDMYEQRQRGAWDRVVQRKQKESLIEQATKEAGEAAGIKAGLPERLSGVYEGEAQRHWFDQARMGIRPSIRGNTILDVIESTDAMMHGEKIDPQQQARIDQTMMAIRRTSGDAVLEQVIKAVTDMNQSYEAKFKELFNALKYSQNHGT